MTRWRAVCSVCRWQEGGFLLSASARAALRKHVDEQCPTFYDAWKATHGGELARVEMELPEGLEEGTGKTR